MIKSILDHSIPWVDEYIKSQLWYPEFYRVVLIKVKISALSTEPNDMQNIVYSAVVEAGREIPNANIFSIGEDSKLYFEVEEAPELILLMLRSGH